MGFDIYQTNSANVQTRMHTLSSLQNPQTIGDSTQDFLVVWNDKTKNFGILTGSILIKLKNFTEKEHILQDYQLIEKTQFAHLNIVVAEVNLIQLINNLTRIRNDSRVSSFELDVIENIRIPY